MFISALRNKLAAYDLYGEQWLNGYKILYLFILLCFVDFIYPINTPYFYYYYVPLTLFAAEVTGHDLREKYTFFAIAMLGSAISIALFGMLSIYPMLFVGFVLCYSSLIYLLVIRAIPKLLPIVPLVLSLAGYSLIYNYTDRDPYVAFNNLCITVLALLVMLGGLYCFPLQYYSKIWQRAFNQALVTLTMMINGLCDNSLSSIPVCHGVIVMERYAKMLPRNSAWFTRLKITLLTLDTIMAMSYWFAFDRNLYQHDKIMMRRYLSRLKTACQLQQPMTHELSILADLQHVKELKVLYRLIRSWNTLCQHS
jgi:hypothetical protein